MGSLKHKRVAITRPRAQASQLAQLLEREGTFPIILPMIAIVTNISFEILDKALFELDKFDWLIVTSVNGVDAMWDRLSALGINQLPANLKIAAIGPKTAQALVDKKCTPDFVPSKYRLEEIVPGLGTIEGKKFLLLRGNLARPILPEMINSLGGNAEDLVIYHTVPTTLTKIEKAEIIQGFDIVTFTSPTTIENFITQINNNGYTINTLHGAPIIACIGPITAKKASELGFSVDVIAQDYTIEGLITALLKFFDAKDKSFA